MQVGGEGTQPLDVQPTALLRLTELLSRPGLDDRLLRGAQPGEADEVVDDGRILLDQDRKHRMADTRTEEVRIAIAGIDPVAMAYHTHEGFDVAPGTIQERADHAVGACRLDAGQAADAAAANQAHEHGLGLIVAGMARGDARTGSTAGQPMQSAVAQLTRARLEIGRAAKPWRQIRAYEWHTQARGGRGGALLIGIAVGPAQMVIDVTGNQINRQLAPQRGEDAEEADRIRATRHRHEHPLPGCQHTVRNNGARDAREHGRTSALHDTIDFGTLRHRSQISAMLPRQRLVLLCILVALTAAPRVRAEPADEDGPTAQPTVDAALKALAERYGPAAVALQGVLLAHAISAGAQLEVTVAIAGKESHAGREYLAYEIDTGIVYQGAEVTKRAQLSRIWTDVVDPALRQAALNQLPGEGLALRIRSHRGQFADRAAIVRELAAQRLQPVATTFILPFDAIRAYLEGQIAASELSTRGIVELDGSATRLEIIPTPIPTEEPTVAP